MAKNDPHNGRPQKPAKSLITKYSEWPSDEVKRATTPEEKRAAADKVIALLRDRVRQLEVDMEKAVAKGAVTPEANRFVLDHLHRFIDTYSSARTLNDVNWLGTSLDFAAAYGKYCSGIRYSLQSQIFKMVLKVEKCLIRAVQDRVGPSDADRCAYLD